MTTIRRFVLRLLSFFRTGATEAELSREIHSHLQLLEDEFVAKGMPRDDARLAARRAFGGVEQVKEHQRDARGFRWLDNSRMDFKLGARMLAKYPALSLIGGAGLAVGVAIGAGFFAFLHSFLYATLPVEGGERIVALENWDLEANDETYARWLQSGFHRILRVPVSGTPTFVKVVVYDYGSDRVGSFVLTLK